MYTLPPNSIFPLCDDCQFSELRPDSMDLKCTRDYGIFFQPPTHPGDPWGWHPNRGRCRDFSTGEAPQEKTKYPPISLRRIRKW